MLPLPNRIAELEAELESSREACRKVMNQYDQQAVALFQMRRLGEQPPERITRGPVLR